MKLKFKHQAYQTDAVQAVLDCFKGQPNVQGIRYRLDPGTQAQLSFMTAAGFRNPDIALNENRILENIQEVQKQQNLPVSPETVQTSISSVNLGA